MRATPVLIAILMAAPLQCAHAQGRVFSSNKLPPSSIELKANESPATSTPWQLPRPGDPLYDAVKEAAIKNNKQSHLVHAFERGVFVGYQTLTVGPPPDRPAKKLQSRFIPNSKLPDDAVELDADDQPDKSDYFQVPPKTRPPNVPANFILVRVFQGKTFIGWSYLPKEAVAALHNPKSI